MNALLEIRLEALKEVHDLKSVGLQPSKFHMDDNAFDHTINVVNQCKKLYPNNKVLLVSSYLHDIGKIEGKELVGGFYIFKAHADISKYMIDKNQILVNLCDEELITPDEAQQILLIVENHMRPAGGKRGWPKNEVRNFMKKFDIYTDNRFELLIRFSDLNIRGSNPNRISTTNQWTKEIQYLKEGIEDCIRDYKTEV